MDARSEITTEPLVAPEASQGCTLQKETLREGRVRVVVHCAAQWGEGAV